MVYSKYSFLLFLYTNNNPNESVLVKHYNITNKYFIIYHIFR
jgi:hypothetical protein